MDGQGICGVLILCLSKMGCVVSFAMNGLTVREELFPYLMKALTIPDRENIIMALQGEIRRNGAARYDHRLHGVLLVARGMTCSQVAQLLGDSPRAVLNWVRRFEKRGLAGLKEDERPGRPGRMGAGELARMRTALQRKPVEFGLPAECWDGPTLSLFLKRELGVELKVRQCQRLFRQLGVDGDAGG